MGAAFPAVPAPLPETSHEDIDRKLEKLASCKDAWTQVPIPDRITLLDEVMKGLVAVAPEWARTGAILKGLDPASEEAGEEWIAGPMVTVRNVRLLREALLAKGSPKPASLHTITTKDPASGKNVSQAVARVFPMTVLDKLTFGGVSCDVYMMPGEPASQGRIYREKPTGGKVSLVLGGGNVSSIAPMDALYKLFVEDEVVLLKMNPVNEHVGPFLEAAFAKLEEKGFFAVIYGGAGVGAYAAEHALVDTLHVTGSDRTYDAIVWGADAATRAANKEKGTPRNTKPFTAELGCVTPVLVVPGPWSEADLKYQARHVASMVAQNASFNCNAAKVLVMARGWLQREAFLSHLHEALAAVPRRKAYYPGAHDRHRAFLEAYPRAQKLGEETVAEGALPWTVIPDVAPNEGEYALTNEAFCGVLAEVTLDLADDDAGYSRDAYPDATRFLAKATRFANESCWGTLSCTILVHPSTESEHGPAVNRAIEELRYGAVGVNCWPGLVYGLVAPTWGAFPGHTKESIVSGVGVVHNTHLFDFPQKSVVRSPWKSFPKLPYFADHRAMASLGRALMDFEVAPGAGQLFRVVKAALRG